MRMRTTDFSLILATGLVASLPVLVYGFPLYSDDGAVHALWYSCFAQQLWDGDWYPRWLQDMNGGLGSPAFFYYPPLPFYATSVMKPLFAGDPLGWQQLGLSASVALIASGISAFVWLERITGRKSALIAALCYLAMPYHTAIDLYIRGAFAELWSFAWMPLVLLYTRELIPKARFAIVGLSISFALLILTHLPTTLILSPFVVCYGLFNAGHGQRMRALGLMMGALALAVGLSASYLMPALLTQHFVSFQTMQAGNFHYEHWFLFTSLTEGFTAELSWGIITMMILVGCAYSIIRSSPDRAQQREANFWICTVAITVLMMTTLSKPLWQILPVLQRVQFPWRFNVIVVVGTTALLAFGVQSLKERLSDLDKVALAIAFILILTWGPITSWAAFRNMPISSLIRQPPDEVDRIDTKLKLRREANEYWPVWTASKRGDVGEFLQKVGKSTQEIVEGSGNVIVERWNPRRIALQVSSTCGIVLNINRLYYPGWVAQLGDQGQGIDVEPSEDNGLLRVSVPPGNHRVILSLPRSKSERAGLVTSVGSFLLTFVLIVIGKVANAGGAGSQQEAKQF
jgi:hypothetical protein